MSPITSPTPADNLAGDTSVCYLAIRMQPSDTVEVRVRDASGREVSARRILATDGGH